MISPSAFSPTTQQFGLPLLYQGQAQKEFFVNQAFAVTDAVLQFAVQTSASAPPEEAFDGTCFRIVASASGEWSGLEDRLAIRISGGWHYVVPHDGMRIFDRSTGQFLLFRETWVAVSEPSLPSGGNTVDSEARTAIGEILETLRNAGIFAA